MTEVSVPPLVSIIVRSMARATLQPALESIAAQTYEHIEIVIVGACGASHPIPATAIGKCPIRFIPSVERLTRPLAANAGIDAARRNWITFLDDDDILLPGHISGLVSAIEKAGGAQVAYSLARAEFSDERVETFGQPFSLMQLYDRSFIHLSTMLFSPALLAKGCRFDPELDIHEDWDFILQLAQHTPVLFVQQQTFIWHADAGSSGAAGGTNQDDAKFAAFQNRVYSKWATQRDALIDRVQAILQNAGSGDLPGAASLCRQALDISQNDPWALNMLAMIERRSGRHADARQLQELAVAIRPQDADFIFNLALLCSDQGDISAAREYCDRARAMAPENPRFLSLAAALAAKAAGQ